MSGRHVTAIRGIDNAARHEKPVQQPFDVLRRGLRDRRCRYSTCYVFASSSMTPRSVRLFRATALVLAAPLTVPARAADPAAPRPAAAAPAYADWSGGYLGLEGSAGGSYGAYNFGPTTIAGRPVPTFRSSDSTGRSDQGRNATTAVGGVFGGWNWQTGPWVYGVEASLDTARLKRPVPSTYGSLRARIGYSFDRYLIYGAFGLTGADARFLADYPDLAAGGQTTARRELGYVGFTLGAGVQYAITDHLALGIDYRYVDLGGSRRPPRTIPTPATPAGSRCTGRRP